MSKAEIRERKLSDGSPVYSVLIYADDGKQVELDCINYDHATSLFCNVNRLVSVTIWQ